MNDELDALDSLPMAVLEELAVMQENENWRGWPISGQIMIAEERARQRALLAGRTEAGELLFA